MLRKAGSSWAEGDRFFDREVELDVLADRMRGGTHTLLTAQRRMGKTSLVRELLRRLERDGCAETVFVDLEDALGPADAIAEIGVQSRPVQGAWLRIKSGFANVLRGVGDRIDMLAIADLRVKLRAGIDSGNWRQRGDTVFAALAENDRKVVLAIDELPILVNRLLKGDDYRITPERRRAVDEFLSWLRKCVQAHQGRITVILSGSVGLEPILRQAGLSAHANIFSPFDLKPWDEETAVACLAALAETYGLDLPTTVRLDMCRRLRCLIPHHVQQFFDNLDLHLKGPNPRKASLEDVEHVYTGDTLGARGHLGLQHYEDRLRMVLGNEGYRVAIEILTEAAVDGGRLSDDAVDRYRGCFPVHAETPNPDGADPVPAEEVLYVLEHDGYLARQSGGYRFVSGLLEDWWRLRHGGWWRARHNGRLGSLD